MNTVYPQPAITGDPRTEQVIVPSVPGITLRDHFAGMALHAMLTCEREYASVKPESGGYAGYAYKLADKMMMARDGRLP